MKDRLGNLGLLAIVLGFMIGPYVIAFLIGILVGAGL